MTRVQLQGKRSAANDTASPAESRNIIGRRTRGGTTKLLATVAALGLLGFASGASGLTLHGGPYYAGSGGVTGTCTVAGNACLTAGATVTCSGLNASSFQNLYFGIRNDAFVNGVKEVGTAGPVAGTDQFKSGTGSISYTGTTTVWDSIIGGTKAVNTKLDLSVGSVTGGTLTAVATGGNPANNSSGDIDLVFQLSSGVTGFSMTVKVQAAVSPGTPSAGSCPTVFDPTKTRDVTDRDVSHVDLGFYYESIPTPTLTSTPTRTPTVTPVPPTDTPTAIPTDTPTAVPTDTPTAIPTDTPTALPTDTPTAVPTATDTPTAIPTDTPTAVPTDTPTAVPTDTPTAIPTDTPTSVPTDTPTALPTDTPTAVPTATDTPTEVPTDTPTAIPTDTPTAIPTDTPTAIPTDTPTAIPTDTPTAIPTDTPTAIPTDTPTAIPTDTPTAIPTDTPTAIPTDTPTAVPTDTPTAIPTDTPTALPTDTPTAVPTATDTPTEVPTDTPTTIPTDTPTALPTDTPTSVPTDTPTELPTDTPTAVPTATDTPTEVPTDTPTALPTDTPTSVPTDTPTELPTDTPTAVPTATDTPTEVPTDTPTALPTDTPTSVPTDTPTELPTDTPTAVPTATDTPTGGPTDTPTDTPTSTETPTETPTEEPTALPTPTPTPMGVCPAVPPPSGCKTGALGKGSFFLSVKAGDPTRSKMRWKLSKGSAATMPELGDPLTATVYRLCVYDGTDSKIMDMQIPAGGICDGKPCWKASNTGFRYKRRSGSPDGVTGMSVKSGAAGKTKVSIAGKGENLSMPTMPLAQAPNPVRVLLLNNTTNACWTASYSAPPRSNAGDTLKWKDKND